MYIVLMDVLTMELKSIIVSERGARELPQLLGRYMVIVELLVEEVKYFYRAPRCFMNQHLYQVKPKEKYYF